MHFVQPSSKAVRRHCDFHDKWKVAGDGLAAGGLCSHGQYWRFRAEEVLSISESLEHEETKNIMRRIADDYLRIAKMVGQQRQREKK